MDFRQLEYIVKISEEKSITKAAEKLYLTQPALNQQLLRLEKELGTQLFIRGRKSMELTAAGEIYVRNAKKILEINQDTMQEISELTGKYNHPIRVGVTPERGLHVFSGIYPEFHDNYPQVTLQPSVMSVKEQLIQLENGNLDYGLMTLPDDDRLSGDNVCPLKKCGFVLAVPVNGGIIDFPADYPEGVSDVISDAAELVCLKDQPSVVIWSGSTLRKSVDTIYDLAGFTPDILFETESNITIIRMVQAGMCYGILPDYYKIHADNVRYYDLDLPVNYNVVLYSPKKRKSNPAGKFLEQLVGKFLEEHPVYESYEATDK